MAKKLKPTVPAENAGETSTETAASAAPKVKKTKAPKVEVPLTPAQEAARKMLADADAAARQELIANSSEKIGAAEAKVAAAKAEVTKAVAELKALKKAVGIKGTFGGKKIDTFFYVKDFPEGKGAPQARQILEIIKAAGIDGINREKVVETMKTVINTKMDRSRLLSYYASRLVEAGVVVSAKP